MPNDVQNLCYEYANDDVLRWYKFAEHVDKIKNRYDTYICDYEQSIVVGEEVTFPTTSSYADSEHRESDMGWVWKRKDGKKRFAFDSFAEKEWAAELKELARRHYVMALEMAGKDEEDKLFLWGKNYPLNSEIKYEYYANGIHVSYPDFVMKDKYGRIHIFEVKSVNTAAGSNIDNAEYEQKAKDLEKLYLACSKKLPDYRFYLPIMKDDEWRIRRCWRGVAEDISLSEFKDSLKSE